MSDETTPMSDDMPDTDITLTDDLEAPDPEINGDEPAELVHFPWDGATAEISEAMKSRGHAYGSYVNLHRALPAIDGLKPVQRRIIFAMNALGVRNDRAFKKSALTVGAVIGRFHPHGDSAVYDAMVRMAQDFQSTTPMIEGQGNWGSLDGDPAAAQRYTESRLSAIASEFLSDLRPEVVPYRPNFSETEQEASLLPVTFPTLLTMGQSGIGWAMGCTIPTHNMAEVIDAAIYLAEHPEATLKQIMKRIPGPDFPGGGVIVNPENLEACYETGQGTIQVQGRFHLENLPGNRQAVIVTELPYQVGPSQLVAQIVKGARDGKITEITEMPKDIADKGQPARVMIACKRGGNVQKLIADLLRYTKLRDGSSFNMNVVVDGKPKVLGLLEILSRFNEFRHGVITKRLEYERSVLERDLHRLLGLLAALDVIDAVVKIIRGSDDDDDAKTKLIAKLRYTPHGASKALPIDDQQAQWIIDMPLKRLSKLNNANLRADAEAKATRIDEITATLTSETGVRDIMVSELKETKRKFGTPRKTVFSDGDLNAPSADGGSEGGTGAGAVGLAVHSGPATDINLYVASNGFSVAVARASKVPSTAPITISDSARLVAALESRTDVPLVVVTERGTAFRVQVPALESRKTKGVALVGLERGDAVATVIADDATNTHALIVTEKGQIKRVEWAMLSGSHAGGVPCMKVPDGDRIIAVVGHAEGDEIIMASAHGQALRIESDKLRPVATGSAGGVAGMGLKGDDRIVSACLDHGEDLITVHAQGFAKKVPMTEYPTKGRGGGGVASSDPKKPTRDPAGEVAFSAPVIEGASLVFYSERGQVFSLDAASLAPVGRAVVAKRAIEVGPGDALAGVSVAV